MTRDALLQELPHPVVMAADLDSQRETFKELTRRYPLVEVEAALMELLGGRQPSKRP